MGMTPAFALNYYDSNMPNKESNLMNSLSKSINTIPLVKTSSQDDKINNVSTSNIKATSGVVNQEVATRAPISVSFSSENEYLDGLRADAAVLHPQLIGLVNNYTVKVEENGKNKIFLEEKYQVALDKSSVIQNRLDNFVLNLDNAPELEKLNLELNETKVEIADIKSQIAAVDKSTKILEDKKQGYLKILNSLDRLQSVDDAQASGVIAELNSNMNTYGKQDIITSKILNEDNETNYDFSGDCLANQLAKKLSVDDSKLGVSHVVFKYLQTGSIVQLRDPSKSVLNCFFYSIYQGQFSSDDGTKYVLCMDANGCEIRYLLGDFVNLFTGITIIYDNKTTNSFSVLKAISQEIASENQPDPDLSDPSLFYPYGVSRSTFDQSHLFSLTLQLIQGGAWSLSIVAGLTTNIIEGVITDMVCIPEILTLISVLKDFAIYTPDMAGVTTGLFIPLATEGTVGSLANLLGLLEIFYFPDKIQLLSNGGAVFLTGISNAVEPIIDVLVPALGAVSFFSALSLVTLELEIVFLAVTTMVFVISTVITIIAAYNRDHFYRQDPIIPDVSYSCIFGDNEISFYLCK